MAAAARLGVPAVAVHQTDLAGYARARTWGRARRPPGGASARALRRRPHPRPVRRGTARPPGARCAPGLAQAAGGGHRPLRPDRRDEALRRELAPNGELIVGYVGRLAPEKQVELLAGVCGLDGVRVVVVGDEPSRPGLEQALPGALFLGRRTGDDLARLFASLDVFAHTGPFETFCQTVQEASGERRARRRARRGRAAGPRRPWAHRTARAAARRGSGTGRGVVARRRPRAADRVRGGRAGLPSRGRTWAAVGDRLIGHYTDVLATRKAVLAA